MKPYRLGCCISSHGFGHAARSLAVMEALSAVAAVDFTVVTQVPQWFFRDSPAVLQYIPLMTDVGLVQQSSLHEDLPATLTELGKFYSPGRAYIDMLAEAFSGCDLILCDIAPAGIIAARKLGIPSVLLENFTWDWIYEGYLARCPGLQFYCDHLRTIYAGATYRIRAVPFCGEAVGSLQAGPIARGIRSSRAEVRQRLGLRPGQRLVLLSMGGGGMRNIQLNLPDDGQTVYVLPGSPEGLPAGSHIRLLGADTEFFHPDLVAASDAIIGKVGYSTIAEVYRAGTPFGYIARTDFRESGPLVDFIRQEMAAMELTEQVLGDGRLAALLPTLSALTSPVGRYPDGAPQCAGFLADLLAGR